MAAYFERCRVWVNESFNVDYAVDRLPFNSVDKRDTLVFFIEVVAKLVYASSLVL